MRRLAIRYLGLVLAAMAIGTAALKAFGLRGPGQTSNVLQAWPFLDMWVRWDAGWYEQIAARGYTFSATDQSAAAFFPVYPLLMRGLMGVTGVNVFLAGEIVTWVMGLAGAFTFFTWARERTSEQDASGATWAMHLWPFAFYLFGAIYTDATFLVWITLAFLFLERRQPWPAMVFGALACATRPLAPAIVLGLLARSLELRRREGGPWRVTDFVPALSGLGLVAYMVYLGVQFGDPMGFATTQAGWGQLSGWAAVLKVQELQKHHGIDLLMPLFHLALALLCLWLGWRARRTLGWGYTVYVAIVVGIPIISSRDFISLGRYAMAGFPVFLQLWLELSPRPRARWAWFLVSTVLLAWMVVRFANGRYIA